MNVTKTVQFSIITALLGLSTNMSPLTRGERANVSPLPWRERVRVRGIITAILLLLITTTTSQAAYYPMKVTDARGKTITIKAKPMRVVSLTPENTEILYSVGLNTRIAGVTKYCNYPAEAQKKPKVGDMNISVEAVVALKPDLVLANSVISDAAIPKLEKLGITVFAIHPTTLSEVARDIRTVGKIVARPKTADAVAKKLEQSVASTKSAMTKKASRSVLVVIQSNPLWTAGPKTFIDEIIKTANCKNIAHDARPGHVPFSLETAVARNPDVIIVGLISDADYFLKNPAWKNTNAVKNNRVYIINNDLLVRSGPRLAQGLKALVERVSY